MTRETKQFGSALLRRGVKIKYEICGGIKDPSKERGGFPSCRKLQRMHFDALLYSSALRVECGALTTDPAPTLNPNTPSKQTPLPPPPHTCLSTHPPNFTSLTHPTHSKTHRAIHQFAPTPPHPLPRAPSSCTPPPHPPHTFQTHTVACTKYDGSYSVCPLAATFGPGCCPAIKGCYDGKVVAFARSAVGCDLCSRCRSLCTLVRRRHEH